MSSEHMDRESWIKENVNFGDTVLDCGAYRGKITDMFVKQGAYVHLLEPHPLAYQLLKEKYKLSPRVTCHQAAVVGGNPPTTIRLYNHLYYDHTIKWIQASSIFKNKPNIDKANWVDVLTVDLSKFIKGLNTFVKVVKIDIEGAEFQVISDLVTSRAIENIGVIVVEFHHGRIPGLLTAKDRLDKLLTKYNCVDKVKDNWI